MKLILTSKNKNPMAKSKKYPMKKWVKPVTIKLILVMLAQICYPTFSWALTSGPQQPEASNFTPADVSNLVDPFTGDFSYNIPMFEIGGYPVNLAYASGVSMDQEATWVGLGWNLNTGAITRDVRGLPDDFWGDEVTRNFNTKPNVTAGGSVTGGLSEIVGIPLNLSYGLQFKYNNYAGFSVGQTLNGGYKFGNDDGGMNLGLGLSTTNGGLDINPNISFSSKMGMDTKKREYTGSLGFGLNINSRTGLSQMNLNGSVSAAHGSRVTNKYTKRTKDSEGNVTKSTHRDNGKFSTSLSGGGSIDFLNPTHTPQLNMPYENFNFSGSFKLGGAVFFGDISGTIAGFYSKQELMYTTMRSPAYGYAYSEHGQNIENALHDFNREKDGPFTNNTPTLPLTNYTYDAFNIKAQGIGGSFRAFRNDVGHVYDQTMINPSVGGSFGAEVELGNAVDFGVDINVNWSESKSGKWQDENLSKDQLAFRHKTRNQLGENVMFKLVGEKVSESDPTFRNTILQDNAAAVKLQDADDPMALNKLVSNGVGSGTSSSTLNNNNYRNTNSRMVRNTLIQCFTLAEVKRAFPVYLKYMPSYAQDHHIVMIIATQADGTRYVFGLPAYNRVSKEITFATGKTIEGTGGSVVDMTKNLVNYSNTDASVNNLRGIDNYFDETITPAYVYTWYLTEVLSPDYSDITGNGPSSDDLGGYVIFNYGLPQANGKVIPDIQNFKWRTPSTTTQKATFNQGLKTILTDDKGTVLYGEKDIWYPSSIESKTQYVKFVYSDRQDGRPAVSMHGGIDLTSGNAQKKIDKIKIYSRQDYIANPGSSIPLKTIHFEYDYSLCKNSPNSNASAVSPATSGGGKLTLKNVFFTYRNSEKARYSAYKFEYPLPNASDNPDYNQTANDRWGSYRANGFLGGLRNEDYPYVTQDKTLADAQSKCWNLKAINLPTGGKINIEYESDDYAFVQNKKACRMMQIVGAGKSETDTPTNKLFDPEDIITPANSYKPYEYLFFDLEQNIIAATEAEGDAKLKQLYFDDPNLPEINGPHKYLYFRFLLNANKGNEVKKNEYVGGYCDVASVDYCGVVPSGSGSSTGYTRGWVKVKTLPVDGNPSFPNQYHPISKAGWSFSRINTPFYANDQAVPGEADPGDFIRTILNADIIAQLINFFKGPNNKLRDQGFASEFVPNSSYIRLYDPNGIKYGGGHRVKSINISDNWANMENTESTFDYGQEYVYTDESGSKSSGVASYEPMYGADENPFRIPVFYDKEYGPLIPDDRFYQEEPFGEGFFPSPSVGYSRVKIMNKQRSGVTKTAAGYTIKEFYTARDFPTITRRTNMEQRRAKIDPLLAIISPYVFDFQAASQGISIELNDMHGKSNRVAVFQEGNNAEPISEVKHFYKLETLNQNEINNNVPVLQKNGVIDHKEIGTEIDMVADFRQSSTASGNIDIGFNTDYMQAGPIPLIILAIFPKIKIEATRFRSASVTKVVNRYGIEMRTEAYDLGSVVRTENKLFNEVSGEVLSTQVNNEYEDDRYTLGIPAYWTYPGLKHASTNSGFEFVEKETGSGGLVRWNRTTGGLDVTWAAGKLTPGDELMYTGYKDDRMVAATSSGANNYTYRLWVASHDPDGPGGTAEELYLIDHLGKKFNATNYTWLSSNPNDLLVFKVIRSGHRNILAPKITEMASMDAPVTSFNVGGTYINNTPKPLSVTANTFSEQWKGLKRFNSCATYSTCVCEENLFMIYYSNLFKYVIENNITFPYIAAGTGIYENDPSTIRNGNDLVLYASSGFYSPMAMAFYNILANSPYNCSFDANSVIALHVQGGDPTGDTSTPYAWIPQSDVNFMNGTTQVSVGLNSFDTSGTFTQVCNPCDKYMMSVKDPSFVPAAYYTNNNCSTSITIGGTPYNISDILFIPITIAGVPKVLFMYKSGGTDCPARTCTIQEFTDIDDNVGDIVNPYIHNILGKWRPYQSYTLIADRTTSMNEITSGGSSRTPNLRDDGYISGYSPFWSYVSGNWSYASADTNKWKRTTTMTMYHPSGPQIEEKNALNIYSAALYGYYDQLAIAVANNAQYKEIGYDGFEDYSYIDNTNLYTNSSCTPWGHFQFDDNRADVVSEDAHTGKHCLKLAANATMTRVLQNPTTFRNTRDVPYMLQAADLTERFGPNANSPAKEFVFSFWAKVSGSTPLIFDYTNVTGDVRLGASTLIVSGSLVKSPIIEGWQKFEYRFIIPANSTGNLNIDLKFTGDEPVYFDDVRIHPFNGNMKSYVYDPLDLRFMAELDENNYATFYEYDEDGALIRVKKETERGVMTIQENRYRSFKQ
jgi:hypothetical protein